MFASRDMLVWQAESGAAAYSMLTGVRGGEKSILGKGFDARQR
jgi:hypothetical protein